MPYLCKVGVFPICSGQAAQGMDWNVSMCPAVAGVPVPPGGRGKAQSRESGVKADVCAAGIYKELE